MNQTFKRTYAKFRQSGERASHAIHAARTLLEFARLENAGLVRLVAEDEEENYFSVYGEPDTEKERKAICDLIDRLGCYCVMGQWTFPALNTGWDKGGRTWNTADSVGMCTGYQNVLSPYENGYVVDIMAGTIEALKQALKSRCPKCRKAA